MDLTQRTHGRLLAALSFNNRYPSPSSSSPSISSVSQVCGLTVCSGPSVFSPLFHMLSPSSETRLRPLYLIFLASEALFHLPLQPGFHTLTECHPFSALPPPLFSPTACTGPIHSRRFYKAHNLLPERQWPTHTSDPLIHAIQIKSEKKRQMTPTKLSEYLEHTEAQTYKVEKVFCYTH